MTTDGRNVHTVLRDRLAQALAASPDNLKTVAHRAGYTPGYISAMAGRGARYQRNPTIGAVWAIAEAVGADPLWLLGADSYPQGLQPDVAGAKGDASATRST